MTVKELIAKLQEFDGSMPVVMQEDDRRRPELVRSVRRRHITGDRGFEGDEIVVWIDTTPEGE